MQLHAGLELRGLCAVLADAHVAGRHALDRAVFAIEHFGCGEAGIDLDAQRFRLLAQPAAQSAQADDVIALVVHLRRRRHPDAVLLGQEQHLVFGRHGFQRCTLGFPVGDQFIQHASFDDRAGEDMRTDLGTFFQHANGELLVICERLLFQTDCRGQTRRACTYHHYIELHRFAIATHDPSSSEQ